MDFLRNKPIKQLTMICTIITVMLSVIGCFLDFRCGVLVFIACITIYAVFMVFTCYRYKRISEISLDIDKVLHGDKTIDFKDYQEGELAILQNELLKMTASLWEQANLLSEEKTHLADSLADISHQLKTPLTALNVINASLSRDDIGSEERFELVREQIVLLSRMEWLISALLKVSRLDAGTITLNKREVSVKELVEHAFRPLEVSAELKKLEIIIDVPQDIMVQVDLEWTAEAVGNIIKNCIEHTPMGGEIKIFAQKRPLVTEVIISDSGAGFAKEDIPHLFERFYQGKDNKKNHVGIGLALAKSILVNQNGMLSAENSSEGGARFIISFD